MGKRCCARQRQREIAISKSVCLTCKTVFHGFRIRDINLFVFRPFSVAGINDMLSLCLPK